MSEPEQASKPIRVDVAVSVSSPSELHPLAAGMLIARALHHVRAPYIVLECNTADSEKIETAEMISKAEMLFRVESRDNISN